MLPGGVGRLSTTTCWPSRAPRRSATTRAPVSVTPPGVKGTTRRIGLFGGLLLTLVGVVGVAMVLVRGVGGGGGDANADGERTRGSHGQRQHAAAGNLADVRHGSCLRSFVD